MSGIAGIYHVDGIPVEESLLLKMREAAFHRGEDGAGLWIHGNIGFAHRLLRNTQESLDEHQPMTNGRGLWITADCRIDNRDELRREFESHGWMAAATVYPDVAFILIAYELWGEDAPNHLLGDFAFAIWDERDKRLFCARDQIGMKPFHYHWDGRKFIFGSEMKQIFQDTTVPRDIHCPHLADILAQSFPNREETPYQAIRKLPPAHSIRVERGGFQIKRYWNWDPEEEPISSRSLQENGEIFLGLFKEAIRARVRTPPGFRAGSLLSGGLDSSSIVSVAASNVPFPVFTLCFPEADSAYQHRAADPVDESRYWQPLVQRYSLESYPVNIQGWGPLKNFGESLWTHETIPFFPTVGYFQSLFALARANGVSALLDGDGGDELFRVGNQCFLEDLKNGHPLEFSRDWIARRRRRGTSYQTLLNALIRGFTPKFIKIPYRRCARRMLPDWLDPKFSKEIHLRARAEKDFRWDPSAHTCSSEGILMWMRGVSPLLGREMMERAASCSRMEVRLPFLDVRLVRFCAAVPWDQKQRSGVTKVLLREALKDFLPSPIASRLGKTEFTPVIRAAFERYAQQEMRETFENPHPLVRSMTLSHKVRKLYQSMKAVESTVPLWYLMAVDQWLKHQDSFWRKIAEVHRANENHPIGGSRENWKEETIQFA